MRDHSDDAIRAHDRQRDFSERAWASITTSINVELLPELPALDLGAGSCLYTERLVAAGSPMVATDISPSMLEAAVEHGRTGFPMVVADGHRLPFASRAFGGALLCQVAHLFEAPGQAFAELARVLQSGAPLIVNPGNVNRSAVADETRARFLEAVREEGTPPPRSRDAAISDLVDQVREAGFDESRPIEIVDHRTRSVGETIEVMEKNPFRWHGMRKRRRVARAAKSVRRWAMSEFGSLEASYEVEVVMTFLVLKRR